MVSVSASEWRRRLRRFNVDLSDDRIFEPLLQYHEGANPDGTLQDTVREILLVGLSSITRDSLVLAARRQAYINGSRMFRTRIAQLLREILGEFEADGALLPCSSDEPEVTP